MAKLKSVQIPAELFNNITAYFLLDERDSAVEQQIIKALYDKFDRMAAREIYCRYKDVKLSDEEREQARMKYLQEQGIHPDFIWSADYELQR